MAKYQTRPVIVEAVQWFPGVEIDGVEEFYPEGENVDPSARIKTTKDIKGSFHYLTPGYWVVAGVKGEKYAVRDDVFRATYDPVEQ